MWLDRGGGYLRRLAFHSVVALALGLAWVLNASAEDSVVFNIPEGETQCPTAGEFAELAGRTVVKRGAGRLVMTDTAAKDVDLVYEDGSLAFTRTLPETVTVSPDDGLSNAMGSDPMVTNSDLTAATATWSPVSFRKSDLEVSADGTKILAPISANA